MRINVQTPYAELSISTLDEAGRHAPARSGGTDRMRTLKLHVPEPDHADMPFPFPGRSPQATWRPRLAKTEHDAERAVREVESRVSRLAAILIEGGDDDDRPRAA